MRIVKQTRAGCTGLCSYHVKNRQMVFFAALLYSNGFADRIGQNVFGEVHLQGGGVFDL